MPVSDDAPLEGALSRSGGRYGLQFERNPALAEPLKFQPSNVSPLKNTLNLTYLHCFKGTASIYFHCMNVLTTYYNIAEEGFLNTNSLNIVMH